MTEEEVRVMLAEALESANVLAFRDKKLRPLFMGRERSIALEELDIDSLAAMELCIAIEVNSGVSIVPEQLQDAATLDGLVRMVLEAPQ